MSELDKTFNPAEVDARWAAKWKESGAFACGNSTDDAYCVMMPPPNVTGSLHMGHALNHSIQDILVRYHRMRGFDTLWQPGTDHAGIATQMVVERQLIHADWRGVLMVGFLGAFTTFSTFSLETIALFEAGHTLHALAYMLGSAVLCVVMAGAAIQLTRLLV